MRVETDGVDLQVSYLLGGPAGTLWSFELQGTYVDENTFYPFAGGADSRGSIPRIKANLYTEVVWQGFDFAWTARYLHSMKNPRYTDTSCSFTNCHTVDAHIEHDVTLAYNFRGYRFVVGANNLFDEEPEYVQSTNANTDLALYDVIGRFVFARVTVKI